MGRFSGHNGDKGRRVQPPPDIFGHQTPDHKDLGIATAADTSGYGFHVQQVGTVDWSAIGAMSKGTDT